MPSFTVTHIAHKLLALIDIHECFAFVGST